MIEPAPGALLDGVADSLEAGVLPDLAQAPLARRQLREGVRVLRRLARALDRLAPSLAADNADMEATLRALAPALPGSPEIADALGAAVPAAADLHASRERNRALQHALTLADAAIHDLPEPRRAEALSELRALYRRQLAREQALNRPPQPAHPNETAA